MDVERVQTHDQLDAVAPGARAMPGEVLAALPARVVAAYVLGGGAWIVGTDAAMALSRGEALGDVFPDMAKGLVFVAVTATVLWVVLRHVTRRFERMFLRTLTAQRDFFGSVLSTSSDVVAIFDPDGRTVWVSSAATDLLGWQPDEMTGRLGREFIHPDDRAAAIGYLEDVGEAGVAPARTFLVHHRDGSYRAAEVRGAPITLTSGERGVVINARDVTDRARSERQLRAALAEDVTGLPGLRTFMAELDVIDELRPEGLAATVAVVDVDRFADVNELHGRAGGDVVLRELADRIEATVPDALGVWRHGADEFLLVLLDERDQHPLAPHALAERLQGVAEAAVVVDDRTGDRVAVELSVGVARLDVGCRPSGESLASLLLRAAEGALADAKRHPDRIAVRSDAADGNAGDRARLVAELHDAIHEGQLVVHYQPKVRLDDLRTGGVEALVRWEHPTRGLLLPGDFLGAVAEANLGAAVLRAVLRDALRCAAGWLAAPGCDSDFAVCVNVSADDLRRRRFPDDVFGALAEAGVAPHRLCLELTEETMLADPAGARQVLDRLRRDGIQIAIDDFGTGYSTLEHVRLFEVDEIKIDRSFVQRLGASPADEAIVDSVLAITQRIGVRVVAEGIEHVEALAYLRERGCHMGQGYLLERPVPADRIDPCRRWELPA